MFDLFRRKQELIFSPCSGEIIPIENLDDDVFSQKLMGDGIAILPSDNKIVSPIDGEVVQIFETKHAILLKSNKNTFILIHVGIDTVELEGKPFNIKIECSSKVSKGEYLMEVNFDMIREAKLNTSIIVLLMDEENKKIITEKTNNNNISYNECIFKVKDK